MGVLIAFRPRAGAEAAVGRDAAPTPPPPARPVAAPPVPAITEPLWREVTGRALREARHRRGQTLADVAARSGVSTPYLSEIERGRKEPSSEVLAAVTGALELTLAELTAATLRLLVPLDLTADRRGSPSTQPRGPLALVS